MRRVDLLGAGRRIVFDIELWKILLGAGLVVLSFFLYRKAFPPIPFPRRVLLAIIRALGFVMLVVYILNPTLITVGKELRRPLVLALLDVSKSMGMRDRTGRSRIEEAVEGLHRFSESLRDASRAELEIIPFSGGLWMGAVPEDSILEASGEGTDIISALRASWKKYRSKNLEAIVLFSDGRVSRGMMTSSGDISVPVYAVGFGDTLERADISVEDVFYERVVYRGTVTGINAVISASGFKGRRISAQLVEGNTVKDNAVLNVGEDNEELEAEFSYTPEEEGDHSLSVRVTPQPEEEREENNSESIRIKVLKDKIRFLYIDQFADWNVTFIRDLVRRSRRFEVEVVAWTPRDGFHLLPDRRVWNLTENPAALREYDLIVLADDIMSYSTVSSVEVLEEYVSGGGGLLLLAGEHSPLRYTPSSRLLERALPIKTAGRVGIETGEYHVRVHEAERENPIALGLADGGYMDDLPPLLGRLSGLEITAGASVPLVLDDGKSKTDFVAIERKGKGVSAVVLGFPLWRWKLAGEKGARAYNAFFSGLIQFLAEGADPPALELEADRTVYRSGDRIGLSVYLKERRFLEGVRGEVMSGGGEGESLVRTFLFEPDRRGGGYFKADLGPLAPGEYRVVASEIKKSGGGLAGEVAITVQPVSVEFLKTSRDAGFLRHLADISGGSMVEVADIFSLPAEMELEEDEIETRKVRTLRESPLLFVCVILLFAAEWTLRKIWGLV